jgi:hypothetical protein
MADKKIHEEPSKVTAEEGVVTVKGPDAVDVRMSPEAASETSERLLFGAMQALGNKVPEADADNDEGQSEGPEATD